MDAKSAIHHLLHPFDGVRARSFPSGFCHDVVGEARILAKRRAVLAGERPRDARHDQFVVETRHYEHGRRDSQIRTAIAPKLSCSPTRPLSGAIRAKNWSRSGSGIRLNTKTSASLRSGNNASDRIIARACFSCFLRSSQFANGIQRGGADAIRTAAQHLPPQLPSAR